MSSKRCVLWLPDGTTRQDLVELTQELSRHPLFSLDKTEMSKQVIRILINKRTTQIKGK